MKAYTTTILCRAAALLLVLLLMLSVCAFTTAAQEMSVIKNAIQFIQTANSPATDTISCTVTQADGSTTLITVSGALPKDVYVTASPIALSKAEEYVAADAQVLFAYDITMFLPAENKNGKPTEYQPSSPVTVTITPPE
ncbi:MAG TPA: hypothetical protein PLT66_03135, partial [Bacillota bacterium]|nr:hypothetical protein [Bacillota bacterium]